MTTRLSISAAFLLLAFACAQACAQAAQPSALAAPHPLYSISGTVVDSVTSEPVSRVSIAVLTTPGHRLFSTVLSESDGHFAITGLPAGKYSLTASHAGYQMTGFDEHGDYSSAIVTGEGQDTTDLTFPITPSATLRIAITDDFGDPVEGAQVYLFHREHNLGLGERLIPITLRPTDESGKRSIYHMQPGDYYVAVSAHPWYALNNTTESGTPPVAGPANPALDVAYPTTFFDGVASEAAATPVTLAPGSNERIAIALHAVPALRVTLPPRPASDPRESRYEKPPEVLPLIFGSPEQQASRFSADESGDGGTTITGLAPGSYELREGEPRRSVDLNLTGSQTLSPSAGSGAAALTVTIKRIGMASLPPNARLFLVWSDKAHPRPTLYADIEDNSCDFDVVPPGTWELGIRTPAAFFPIQSTSVDGQIHAGNRLRVADKPLNVEIAVHTATTNVEGFAIKDAKGKPGVVVLLIPQDLLAHADLVRLDQSDSDGSFAFRCVAPGVYTAIAIEKGWDVEWQRPEILARYLSKGVAVTVPDQSVPVYRLHEAVPIQPADPRDEGR
jgi:hypothetical protein